MGNQMKIKWRQIPHPSYPFCFYVSLNYVNISFPCILSFRLFFVVYDQLNEWKDNYKVNILVEYEIEITHDYYRLAIIV